MSIFFSIREPADIIDPVTLPEFKVEFGAAPGLPGGVLVRVTGPIDAKSTPLFKAQVEALRTRRIRHLLFEMGDVRYVNSSGLAYLITLAETMKEGGGEVALVNVQPKVKVIFETMGLLGFVRFFPSPAAAVRQLRPSRVAVETAEAPAAEHAPRPGTIRRLFRRLFGPPSRRNP